MMSRCCCCCWCFYARRDETRQLLYSKPTVWKISGSGRQVADRHACDQGGRAKGGNQRPDRAAVIGVRPPRCDRTHLTDGSQLDVHVWLSGSQRGAESGRNSAQLISFTGCGHKATVCLQGSIALLRPP
ncbi:uncharacterized protein V6R79_020268 [Siganus canaliculatus]